MTVLLFNHVRFRRSIPLRGAWGVLITLLGYCRISKPVKKAFLRIDLHLNKDRSTEYEEQLCRCGNERVFQAS